ncbi:PREDICTED: uncharacterized protein LOC109241352 [Nicotiana attenuata]|uniref:uncharacterized protein LOC109241352 n=1 Tax=Nicotiana attenuata TaxID=49451 RepID=UPI0009055D04|nr:PREDICTED: uncharacterized protein LOC109241352 [Nicotiana attenuata]
MVSEKVLLKVSPMKGNMRFSKKGKLSSRFVAPFEVLERIGEVTYRIALPPSLSGVYPILHESVLRKFHADRSHVLDYSTVQLDEILGYEEEPVAIIDRQVCQLRFKKISPVKVRWRGQPIEEATWDTGSRWLRRVSDHPELSPKCRNCWYWFPSSRTRRVSRVHDE